MEGMEQNLPLGEGLDEIEEVPEVAETAIPDVVDPTYEAVLTQVMENLDPAADMDMAEIAEIAQRLDVPQEVVELMAELAKDSTQSLTELSSEKKESDLIFNYCTFAGCQGTCRGCAGRK